MSRIFQLKFVGILFCCVLVTAQMPDSKNFSKDGVSFDYPTSWQLQDDTNGDAQQLTLTKAGSDVQIRVFVHKGRITAEKLPDAKKAFIDPYIAATAKQFVAMGAKPEQVPDSSEIGGIKADGTSINASLGGETGAAKIYWSLVGQRVVVLTLFGPDKQLKQLTPAWDLVRTSLKVVDPKAVPAASPKASP
ncbi:MAG TPA: hypothetical protein VGQ41_20105 [Pyrinomonadaceae bacterium]|jgi:hypothetical protein|nr:hypothetical protein [Pyrinomonadaceae bacterium]